VNSTRAAHRFDKGRRLRQRGEFQKVFDTGVRARGRYWTILAAPAQTTRSRLGIVASKKLGDAVRRNRAKRLIREIFRRTENLGAAIRVDMVVIPRVELFDATFASLVEDYRTAAARCMSQLARVQPSNAAK
jgi:ribonuclease P protein component